MVSRVLKKVVAKPLPSPLIKDSADTEKVEARTGLGLRLFRYIG